MAYFDFNLDLRAVSFNDLVGLPASEKGETKARKVLQDVQGNIIEMRQWRGAHDPIENAVRWRVSTSLLAMWQRIADDALEAIETLRALRIKQGDTQLKLFNADDYLSEKAKKEQGYDIPF